jgi:hypothetical protein
VSRLHGNPREDLKHVKTRDEAARLHDDLVETLDYERRQPGGGPRVRELNQVLNELEDDWDLASKVFGDDGHGKPRREGLGPGGRRFKQSGRAVTRSGKNRPKPSSPTRPRPGGRGRTRAFAGGYLLGRRRALEATRLPGAVRTTSANVMYALGAIIFLAIVYDILSAGKAPALFAQSVTGFLDRVVGLKDPLAPLAGNVEQGVHLGNPQSAGQNLTNVATNALKPLPKGVNVPGITPLVHPSTGVTIPGITPLVKKPHGHAGLTPSQLGAALLNDAAAHSGVTSIGDKVRRYAHPNRHRGHHH